MPTAPLSQLRSALAGRYEIERELGRGGMATVYLARDVRHHRNVALKVLDPELAAVLGAERFLSEIRTTANLQHPHILPLFDSGEAEGQLYYVMPFVDGESLRARLERERQLPFDDAIRIAREVADALAHAHARGILHRDIKPENILLQGGHALVADFGIALAVQQAGGARMTQTGLSLGTPQYMSPEQAMGERSLDARTDVYALGAVTYEMLAGEPPFTGPTVQAIVAKVMTERPVALRTLRDTVPPPIEAAILKALAKLPADRFTSASAFGEALVRADTAPPLGTGALATTAAGSDGARRVTRRVTVMLAAALVAAVGVGAWGWLRTPATPSTPRLRFTLDFTATAPMNPGGTGNGSSIAFTPDGGTLIYMGGTPIRQLWARRLDELTPRPIPGTERASAPEVSPDGRWVAFLDGDTLKRVPLGGGTVVRVASPVTRFTWAGNDAFILSGIQSQTEPLARVSADGGAIDVLTDPARTKHRGHARVKSVPGGRVVLFVAYDSTGAPELAALRLDTREVVMLGVRGANPVYVPGGFLLFVRASGFGPTLQRTGLVSAVRFDLDRLRVIGDPVDVLEDVIITPNGTELAIAPNGTLAYFTGQVGARVVQLDRRGAVRDVISEVRVYQHPRVSPDGKRIAVTVAEAIGPRADIWVYDIASATLTRLTNGGRNVTPRWTPDGRRVAWTRTDTLTGVWMQPWDASSPPQLITTGRGSEFTPSGDGLLANFGIPDDVDLRLVPVPPDSTRPARAILKGLSQPTIRISPDGRWLAYVSAQSGTREVYVQPFPGPGGRMQVSAGGGTEPVWAPNGKEIFYRGGQALLSAAIRTSPEFSVPRRDTLFTLTLPPGGVVAMYDVMPDGNHFLAPKFEGFGTAPIIVTGWAEELRQRLATRR